MTQLVKNLMQCGRPGSNPWVGKITWRRERLPILVFCPGEFQDCIVHIVHGVSKSQTRLSDFHLAVGHNKDRNGKELIEAEEIKKRWQEYRGLYKKFLTN